VSTVVAAENRTAEVVTETWPVLLDFDGPVTHLFIDGRNRRVADQIEDVLVEAGVRLPVEIHETVDPLMVLAWSALHAPEGIKEAAELACVAGEFRCVAESTPTRVLVSCCWPVGTLAVRC
jgi:phosphoglycolate phosphatase